MKALIAVLLSSLALALSATPLVSTITPAAGSIAGGDYVHIHGSDLQLVPLPCTTPCALKVTFGGVEAQLVSDTDAEIVAVAPPHAAGSVDVAVTLLTKGEVTIANGYRYEDPLASDNVRFLVPIAIGGAGALGSNWMSELSITNSSAEPLTIASTTIAPRKTAQVTLPASSTGAFFSVPKRLAGDITASLRVHDTTRDVDGWGADIPVVPETQFRPSVVLNHIPADARFRTLLRVYTYRGEFGVVAIAIRDDATGEFLTSQSVAADGYAQIALDPIAAPYALAHPRLRVEVVTQVPGAPLAPPEAIWGFVSVTNNATQQATTITPSLIPSTLAQARPLELGHWAGGGACVDETNTDVTVTLMCATGHFAPPPTASNGRFEADGTYKILAGPALPGAGIPAHYSGVINGNTLDLTIAPQGGTPFTVHVTYGSTEPCGQTCV